MEEKQEANVDQTDDRIQEGAEELEKLNKIGWKGEWAFEEDLKYDNQGIFASDKVKCARIGCDAEVAEAELKRCAKCKGCYCKRDCQIADWKKRHKYECNILCNILNEEFSKEDKRMTIENQMQRIRMYMCPYVVVKTESLGRGIVYVSSTSSLTQWVCRDAVNHQGKGLDRSFKLEFFTLDDWDAFVADNFELAAPRKHIKTMIDSYDIEKQFVLVLLFACGHYAGAIFPLVPDAGICKRLGDMYEFAQMDSPLQLNVDTADD